MNNNYRILLYYKYVNIEDPESFKDQHLKYCQDLGVLGRIIVSSEGINGTISGTIEQTNKYMEDLNNNEVIGNVTFKIDESDQHAFSKMHVRHKKELVNLSLEEDVNPLELTGNYLDPKMFYKYMQDENTVIIDARNDYEYDLGHFRGAIKPEIKNFRQLPQWIRDNKELFENKKILTYCTGGVRCEKFSGFLLNEGFTDVNQLHGGIATYGKDENTKGALWDGLMYVFDNRISVGVNQLEHVVVGKDYFDNKPEERYINCSNPSCNKQIITSVENEHKYLGACSHECRISKHNRYVAKYNLSPQEVNERLKKI